MPLINSTIFIKKHANLSLVLVAPLSKTHFRIVPQRFWAFMRWHLAIPQLTHLGNASPVTGLDYAAEIVVMSMRTVGTRNGRLWMCTGTTLTQTVLLARLAATSDPMA